MEQKRKSENGKRASLRALAARLGRSASHICRVLNGERKASAGLARELRRLGVEVA